MKQIILFGPPGTGKTYRAQRMAAHLLGFDEANEAFKEANLGSGGAAPEGAWEIVQFHPSYNYEDFVRGVTSRFDDGKIHYQVVDRVFGRICRVAAQSTNKDKRYVLIIDEINRANLPAVLGELLYALEYRGASISTPYAIAGDSGLTVPENVYVIGTMNTSDRSIGHLDYAVRRRFAFLECLPEQGIIDQWHSENASPLGTLARQMFDAVSALFDDQHYAFARLQSQ